ncbi:hypothetical protein NIES2107_12920 [Nostoc carneum NIES-2107]|nr:hypothetical protein NIES2107_12920 [Nostoc carneum NIES-2107]
MYCNYINYTGRVKALPSCVNLNVKPPWLQGFALTPSPSPAGRGEQEIQFPFSLREKGLGDEGVICTTRVVYSF